MKFFTSLRGARRRSNPFFFARRNGLLRCARNDGSHDGSTLLPPHPQSSSPGLTGRSSIPETSVIEPRGRGVLDTPHARGMTVVSGGEHRILPSLRGAKRRSNPFFLRAAQWIASRSLSSARVRATRWLAMTVSCSRHQNGLLRNFEPFSPYRQGSSTALVRPIRSPAMTSGLPARACSAIGEASSGRPLC